MIWNVSVGVNVEIDYDDIEADSREEAAQIAKQRALEDVDYNNGYVSERFGVTVYAAWVDDEREVER